MSSDFAKLSREPVKEGVRLILSGGMLSHPGSVREANEDTVAYVLPTDEAASEGRGALLLVADGMGGHAAGEVASRLAAQTISDRYFASDSPPPFALAASFTEANETILRCAQGNPDCAGMGTTCTALAIRDSRAYLAHVGDSRAYLYRAGELHQVTEDQSLVTEMIRSGKVSAEDAAVSPLRHIILQALGTKLKIEPAVWREGLPLRPGDVIVLCSDGLSDLVDDEEIRRTVASMPPLAACHHLVDAALAAGGRDNVSVGVFAVDDQPASGAAPERPTRKIVLNEVRS